MVWLKRTAIRRFVNDTIQRSVAKKQYEEETWRRLHATPPDPDY